MIKPKKLKAHTSPTSESISDESRQQWLEFCEFLNEGLARPYADTAIGNRLFELGVETVMVSEHKIAWRDYFRRKLLGCQTQSRKSADKLTKAERAAVDQYLEGVDLTPETKALYDEWNSLPREEQRKRAK